MSRLLTAYRVGEKVRAVDGIFYAVSGEEVPAGTVGRVQEVGCYGCGPLVRVCWDGYEHIIQVCSAESIEHA